MEDREGIEPSSTRIKSPPLNLLSYRSGMCSALGGVPLTAPREGRRRPLADGSARDAGARRAHAQVVRGSRRQAAGRVAAVRLCASLQQSRPRKLTPPPRAERADRRVRLRTGAPGSTGRAPSGQLASRRPRTGRISRMSVRTTPFSAPFEGARVIKCESETSLAHADLLWLGGGARGARGVCGQVFVRRGRLWRTGRAGSTQKTRPSLKGHNRRGRSA